MAELKFSSHFRSEKMVVPRNLNDFYFFDYLASDSEWHKRVFFFLKSNTISFVLDTKISLTLAN